MRAGINPEAQNSQGRKEKREGEKRTERLKEEEREEGRVEAQIVRLPAWSTLEKTDYEKQWEARRA